jgi:RNA polymerase sigma-70 factor, ECF subfamily
MMPSATTSSPWFSCVAIRSFHGTRAVALTLKTVGAFSVREIAAAFLSEPATIAQRIVRAKRTIIEKHIRFELPRDAELRDRLDSVLDVLYLLFNEGYNAHEGESLVRNELCHEAIRLARLLTRRHETDVPRLHALLALMLLQASRLPARIDRNGTLLLLDEQDRSLWDRTLMSDGMRFLESSAFGDDITTYHIQARIAAAHAVATDESSTDWPLILRLYDDLSAISPSPVVELNRAVAVAMVHGPRAGIRSLETLRAHPALARYYLLPATLAGLWLRACDAAQAAACYGEALGLPCTEPERSFMQKKLAECMSHGSTPSAQ